MKNCSNCKHRDKFITEKPCIECRFTECWEGEDNESTGDNRASEADHSR